MDTSKSQKSQMHPLRPYSYYVAPSPEDFTNAPSSSSSSTRPARYASVTGLLDEDGLDTPSTVVGVLRGLLSTGLLGFASTACVMPFEVGKTMMQVQWIPKADVELLNDSDEDQVGEQPGSNAGQVIYDVDELSDEDDAQAYFHDLNNSSTGNQHSGTRRAPDGGARRRRPPLETPSISVTRDRDASGYIIRRSIFEQSTKPEWILPFTVTGGVWDMMKAIGRWKSEGWLSLWKGQLTTFCMESLSSAMQSTFYALLVSVLLPESPFVSLPLVHIPNPARPLAATIASHMITSYLLSPLDLVRTRLIVQSGQARHRKYSGPIDALKKIYEEEGGLRAIYTHSNLVFPSLLDTCVRSFFHLSIPLFIERRLYISPDNNSIIYGLAEFTFSTCALLITLPIETVRKRLQVQSRAEVVGGKSGRSYKACVETRPGKYAGIVETTYRILTEETGRLYLHNADQKPRRPPLSRRGTSRAKSRQSSYRGGQREQDGEMNEAAAAAQRQEANLAVQAELAEAAIEPPKMPFFAGVTQLFRGFSMGLSANLVVLVLGLVAGRDDAGNAWTEM
ncbi:MAG: hypothetical protein CYPHOPRED_005092 [Cyphobasidiales sp. Tagirdzhanova-0007]|nr:MAG: hypothetical protein CYPHOPRED_005092 [Cyphobasidiales sp. Tagirdzhanova-0007]